METVEINVRENKDYYTQRNNKVRPYASCNVTSMIMAIDYMNIPFPTLLTTDTQPEDALYDFIINDSRIDEAYRKEFPNEYKAYIDSGKDYKKTYPPTELHSLLSYGTNLWLGKERNEITFFSLNVSLLQVLNELAKGRPMVMSGIFGKLHHIVCVSGFTTQQLKVKEVMDMGGIILSDIVDIIIEDPWGNYKDNYKTILGKDIHMPIEDYFSIISGTKDMKWGHFFKTKT